MWLTGRRNYTKNKHISLLVCYEQNCGGESITTEHILRQLKFLKKKGQLVIGQQPVKIKIKSFALNKLQNSDSLHFFSWHIKSIITWLWIIFKTYLTNNSGKTNYRQRKINSFFTLNKNRPYKTVVATSRKLYSTTFTAGFAAVLLKPFFKHRIYFHYHGNRVVERSSLKLSTIHRITQIAKHKFTLVLHKIFLKHCQLIIVPSQFSGQYLQKKFPFLKNKKIIIIPNGVNQNKFKAVSRAKQKLLKKIYKLPQKVKVLAYIGAINHRKNINLLIKTYAEILKLKPKQKILLLIAHPKISIQDELKYFAKIKADARRLQLNKKILWISNCKKIEEIYQISDMVVVLSKYEDFLLVTLEALATGNLFLSSTQGFPEKTLEKINSQLFISSQEPKKIAKQILRVLNWPAAKKKNFIQKSKNLVKDYSWENTARQLFIELMRIDNTID
ncbi:MAG: glycosyltransferase family 4 protein [Candidatus Woesebacteria bacterium]|jgi:glycosyltransferase involved in cell wall biosynthesis